MCCICLFQSTFCFPTKICCKSFVETLPLPTFKLKKMIDLGQATIDTIVIHKIGLKATEENDPRKVNFYSKREIQISDEQTQDVLKSYFFRALKSQEIYQFLNNDTCVAREVAAIFEQKAKLYSSSIQMAEKLYDVIPENDENHSEFYVAHFSNCMIDDLTVDAVGIFKSESKDVFLKIMQNENEVNFQSEEGINIKKLDKGAIIFNVEQENGYIMKALDNSKGDNVYWIDSFLEAKVIENEYFNTESFIKICKDFNEEILGQNQTVTNEERVRFLQNSLDYFQKNQTFNQEEFEAQAIGHPEVIKEFDGFKQRYRNQYEVEAPESFEIDSEAVKKAKRYLRSVIKLDKNFHIYVHSRPEFIERGYDENKGKSFYKVFFEVES